jgi:hypothetical protein
MRQVVPPPGLKLSTDESNGVFTAAATTATSSSSISSISTATTTDTAITSG